MNFDISWILLILFLLGLVYTLIVIKEEKSSFKESALPQQFHQYKFLIPSWWGQVENSDKKLRYQRLDTRYEWEACFEYFKTYQQEQTIEEQFTDLIQKMKMMFDPDSGVIMNPTDFKAHPHVQSERFEIVRIEGTATENEINRRYLDAFLLRDTKTQTALFATSLSSVLNGLVEGPYFEEVMLSFDIGD